MVHRSALEAEKDLPLEVDVGSLAVTDLNPVDADAYTHVIPSVSYLVGWAHVLYPFLSYVLFCSANREAYLAKLAREGVQILLSKLFSLPVNSSPEGPLAQLPKPTTLLPRAKPLPKPKPLTKWEKFAAAKGINKQKKEKKVWDEEKQIWVSRWGHNGKNKEKEEQWIQVVPNQARMLNLILTSNHRVVITVFDALTLLPPADDYNPASAAKAARKQRVVKNEAQRQANLARAERSKRKTILEKTLLTTKASTASMGR